MSQTPQRHHLDWNFTDEFAQTQYSFQVKELPLVAAV